MSDTFAAARYEPRVGLVSPTSFDVGCRAMAKRWRVYSDASGQSKIAEMPLEMKPFVDTEGAHGHCLPRLSSGLRARLALRAETAVLDLALRTRGDRSGRRHSGPDRPRRHRPRRGPHGARAHHARRGIGAAHLRHRAAV